MVVTTDHHDAQFSIPIIDLKGIHGDSANLRAGLIKKVQYACEKWGFFQVVNHGIPTDVLDGMLCGIRRFHEQNSEAKKKLNSRDFGNKKMSYTSSIDMYQYIETKKRDTFSCFVAPDPPKPEQVPSVCREIVTEYSEQVMKLGVSLFELLSEALGLNPNKLKDMGCAEGHLLVGHGYPACAEPELTLATAQHADACFITILLQDQVGGLQVLHENQWVNVPPMHGALIVNIGDLMQLITNDKFISVDHRVVAKNVGPRTSVGSFFRPYLKEGDSKVYGPIKELLSEETPQIYRETDVRDYLKHYFSKGEPISSLPFFKL